MLASLRVRQFGRVPYEDTWIAMKDFTDQRQADTPDEIWVVEHNPVFTLGQAGKESHILNRSEVPVVRSDRGGQVTYHGPGQLVLYLLIDLKRAGLGVRALVTLIEETVIEALSDHGVTAIARKDAPGVYVDGKKVAALGLRVRKGCSYHGLSLNVDMDLTPFADINPCGYEGLEVIDTRHLGIAADQGALAQVLIGIFHRRIGYHAAPDERDS